MENIMFSFLEMGGIEPDVELLSEACGDLKKMMTQKTAGQGRTGTKKHISFDNLERIKATIIIECMALYVNGYFDKEETCNEVKTISRGDNK